nr:MAG TPA: hypothetical protein [Caudoviricetes sp.]
MWYFAIFPSRVCFDVHILRYEEYKKWVYSYNLNKFYFLQNSNL